MAVILSEDEIRQITLNGANLVPRQVHDKNHLHREVARVTDLFQRIFFTLRADCTIQHRTAACNLLSNLIEKCAQSTEHPFQLALWQTDKFWRHAFWIYLDQHHALNVKPSRNLLTSLTSVLAKCQDKSLCEPEKAALLESLVQAIVAPSENASTRPAMQAIAHWLSKRVVAVADLCNVSATLLTARDDGVTKSTSVKGLLDIVLRLAAHEDFVAPAGSLAALILQKASITNKAGVALAFGGQNESFWSSTVLKILEQSPRSLENFRQYVFPEIFPQHRPSFVAFLQQLDIRGVLEGYHSSKEHLPLSRSQREDTLFCALSVGSKLGLVKVADVNACTDDRELFFEKDVLCIPDTLLRDLLQRKSDAVRIAGLEMLTLSTTTTQPLSVGALNALRHGLPLLHADSDAGFRSELFSIIRHLMERIKAATATLAKPQIKSKTIKTTSSAESLSDPSISSESIASHKSFVEWYVSFLKTELRPTASYQRHVSALRCITIIVKCGIDAKVSDSSNSRSASSLVVWPFTLNVIDDELTDLLLDLLLNAYDDVRSMAAEIMNLVKTKPHGEEDVSEKSQLIQVLSQAESMMKLSGRADQADGVAHIYSILFSQCSDLIADHESWWRSQCTILEHLVHAVEETLDIVTADIGKAVTQHPLHGLFISLRYIIEKPGFYQGISSDPAAVNRLQLLYTRLYKVFENVWRCVYNILCYDTTEGVATDELEEEDIGTSSVLSYSWRALKESSLLLRTLVRSCPFVLSDQTLLSPQTLRQLGDLTFTQLAELRHRGAFSTVAQTFVVCCIRSNSGAETVSQTLEEWYNRAISCIQNQTAINTRRSAGLPSLMIAIVTADNKGVLFGKAMRDLTAEGTRPVDQTVESASGLSQVHALNCIKDIIKNSKLGERSEAYVPEALSLAAKCLSSDTWAVRNSGLMLFRALMDRLVGTNDAYTDDDTLTQSRVTEESLTSLMQVILGLLGPRDGDVDQVNTEAVFPALQLLQRVQPPQIMLEHIQRSVLRLASNRQWHVRDKAAKTYATLVAPKDRINHAAALLRSGARTQNEAHGSLLGVKYLIERQRNRLCSEDMDTLITVIQSRMDDLLYDNPCPFTQAAFVDVQTAFFYAALQKQRHLFGTRWATTEDLNIILDLPRDHFVACSSLRQSLALSMIHEHALFSGPSDQTPATDLTARVYAFGLLAIRDPDACTSALREAARIGFVNSVYAAQTAGLLANIAARILSDDNIADIEVQDAAQEVLQALLSCDATTTTKQTVLKGLHSSYLPYDVTTPLFSDKRLVLQGALLNLKAEDGTSETHMLAKDFNDWVLRVRNALQDTNPFDTRFAAATAVQQLHSKALAKFSSIDMSHSFLDLCVAVYDLNNDDDDEIRALASPIVATILRAHDGKKHDDMVPLAANYQIAEFVASSFGSSDSLALIAIGRLTDHAVSTSFPGSVRDNLDEKSKSDSSLFQQEKQNLFIDETREVKIWSSVAARLNPTAFSFRLLMNLGTWVTDGLDVLTTGIEAKPDTPLGWSRKSKVFILGMQILYAAELILKLSERGVQTPVEARAVVKRLEMFLSKGQENGANVLWLQTTREILQQQQHV